jgi:hypothetical protein
MIAVKPLSKPLPTNGERLKSRVRLRISPLSLQGELVRTGKGVGGKGLAYL